MALIFDTGPIIAMLDRRDSAHQHVVQLIRSNVERRVIPSPVLVEVDYWIHVHMTPAVIIGLLDNIKSGAFDVEDLLPDDYSRVSELCDKYVDSDIGFVDASVLAITERLREPKLATLDRRHFGMMRPRHVDALILVPEL